MPLFKLMNFLRVARITVISGKDSARGVLYVSLTFHEFPVESKLFMFRVPTLLSKVALHGVADLGLT